jgi:Fe-S cluster assembly protein SufD
MTAHLKIVRNPAEEKLGEQYDAARASAPNVAARDAAFALFEAKGLPGKRVEAWHYSDLRAFMTSAAPLAAVPDEAAIAAAPKHFALERTGEARLVFVDGFLIRALSTPGALDLDATEIAPLAADADAIVALNAAFAGETTRIRIPAGATQSLHLAFVGAGPSSAYSRVSIEIGAGAEVTLVETHESADGAASQTNSYLSISAAAGARVEHVRLQAEGDSALALSSLDLTLAQDVQFSSFAFVAGGRFARHQVDVAMTGTGATLNLAGLSLLAHEQHADATMVVRHKAEKCVSREYFKHIVSDEATGVFQGKVVVERGAQKTDGAMKSRAILLSPGATMNNKPELEIFADDVVCGHGATVGALDAEQLFYLQARGLTRAEAEAMLLEAFGAEALERVKSEGLRELLSDVLRAWLAARAPENVEAL